VQLGVTAVEIAVRTNTSAEVATFIEIERS